MLFCELPISVVRAALIRYFKRSTGVVTHDLISEYTKATEQSFPTLNFTSLSYTVLLHILNICFNPVYSLNN